MRLAPLAVVAALLVTAAPSAQAKLGQGRLVFASTRALNYGAADLMTIDAQGRRRNITQSVGVADVDPDFSPDGRRVVFSRTLAGGESDLFTITPGGEDLRRLTTTPAAREVGPAYSPDGDAVGFIREAADGSGEIWIKDPGGERRLASIATPQGSVAWSPDGSRLTFVDATRSELFVVARDGSGLRRLADDQSILARPTLAWLPAGIVTAVDIANGGFGLRLVDPETGTPRPMPSPCSGALPSFSSDRAFVACGRGPGRHVTIRTATGRTVRTVTLYPLSHSVFVGWLTLGSRGRTLVYDAAVNERDADIWLLGSRLRRLTDGPGEDWSPALSPDRRRVVFVRSGPEDQGEGTLLVVSTDGGAARPLFGDRKGADPAWAPRRRQVAYTRRGAVYIVSTATRRARRLTGGRDPAWSPDGRSLAFIRVAGRTASIRTIGVDGSRERRIAGVKPDTTGLAWSPDGRHIAFAVPESIAVVSVTTGRTRVLVSESDNNLSSPTWSPNGRRLAYAAGWSDALPYPRHAPDAHFLEIWAVDFQSGATSPLVRSVGLNYAPDWR